MTPISGGGGILSAVPTAVPLLDATFHGLCRPVVGPSPFLVEGAAAWAAEEPVGSGIRVTIEGHLLLKDFSVGQSSTMNTLVFPGLVRRELTTDRGTCLETVLVAPRLPFVLLQWSGPAAEHPAEVALTGPVIDRGPGAVAVEREGGSIAVAALVDDETSGVVSLLLAAGEPNRVRSALAAAAHATSHAQRSVRGPGDDGLVLRTGVPEIDDGVAWARSRIKGSLSRASDPSAAQVRAAIAVGERDATETLLRSEAMRRHPEHASLMRRHLGAFGGFAAPDRASPVRSLPTVRTSEARASFADQFRTDPDTTWASWRETLASGLSGGPAGPGSWDAVEDEETPMLVDLVLGLTRGLLGLDPDAEVSRIGIAPRLPSHLSTFSVSGIGVGEARLHLSYEREGSTHSFSLEPERGAVPPLAVFEPRIPGLVTSVRVDGESADLDPRPEQDRTVVPIQIPVDGRRTIEIEAT